MKKFLIITGGVLTGAIVLVFVFVSPIVKYLIQKNSVEWTGRKIEIGHLFLNIFSGSVSIGDLKIYESDQKQLFLSLKRLETGISIASAMKGKYEVKAINADGLTVTIIQNGTRFNYDDVIHRFASGEDSSESKPSEAVQWWIRKIKITNSAIHYLNTAPKSEIGITSLNISSPGLAYNSPDYHFLTEFSLASGGSAKVDWFMNMNSMNYSAVVDFDSIKVNFLLPYLTDYLLVKSLDGYLSSDLFIRGDLNKSEEVAASGKLLLDAFSIVDTTGEKLMAANQLSILMDTINTAAGMYQFDEIVLSRPFVQFAMYDDGYNFDRILTAQTADSATAVESVAPEEYSNLFRMLADYVKSITENYLVQQYAARQFRLIDGHVAYTDYTLNDKFLYNLDSLSITSNNINSAKDSIRITLESILNKTGLLTGFVNISTANLSNMKMAYSITGLKLSDINPYSKFYVATPFLNGDVTYENKTSIADGKLKSSNHLLIEQIKVGNKTGSPLYDVPVKLAVGLLTDLKGNIDLNVPVEGDLNDPNYKWGKVVWQVLENIMLKAVTSPYRLLANAFGGNEKDYEQVYFDYGQSTLGFNQVKVLKDISNVLKGKPELKIEMVQLVNNEEELEYLALVEMKKQFLGYKPQDSVTQEIMSKILQIENKDSMFVQYINSRIGRTESLTAVQEKCVQILGRETLASKQAQLVSARNAAVVFFFNASQIDETRYSVQTAPPDSTGSTEVPQFSIKYNTSDQPVAETE